MKKRFTMTLLFFFASLSMVMAQTMKVTGTVTSGDDGEPIIGATILVKGTNIGTITDLDGKFSLDVPEKNKILQISYVGMTMQEVAVKPQVIVVLQADVTDLDEVVVTALGLTREKKSLGYALQEVKADELTKAGQLNVASSLAGKVAGVQITSAGGQVGASQRIVIRGNSSLGSNEPLIVVDGVPIANDQYRTDQAVDYGSGLQDINPEDIESISVLKGGSAALYGMRAGNGVILITTKSGKMKDKGIEIRYDGHFAVDQMYNLPKMQNKYGQGYEGSEYDYSLRQANGFAGSYQDFATQYGFAYGGVNGGADESWGPRLDVGLMLPQVNSPIVDGVRQATPWVSQPNNIKDFLQLGTSMNHNLSFLSQTEKASTRASLGYRDQTGTIPNTDQKRYSAQLNTQLKVNKYIDYDLSLNYTRTESDNLPQGGYNEGNPMQSLMQWFGRQVDMKDLKENWDKTDPVTGKPYSWNPDYHQNPYYTVNKNLNKYQRNRLFGKTSLFYKPFEFLKFEGRLGYDYYDTQANQHYVYNTAYPDGWFRQYNQKQTELNADFIAYFNKNIADFSINLLAGANYRNVNWEREAIGGNMLTVPGLFTMGNVKGSPITEQDHSHIRSNSIYASGSFGYKSMLYLDISVRNDWSSTIEDPFFYPSFSASWIPTATFEGLQSDILNFLKIRGGWAKVGSATSAYRLGKYYGAVSDRIFGNSQFVLPSVFPPSGLRPESVKTGEAGIEANFFDHRLGIDLAYYHKITTDQIMEVATSKATGYNSMLINAGKLRNKGWELQLTGTVIREKDWDWTLTVNWSKDKSKIEELYTDPVTGQSLTQYTIGSEWSTYLYAKPGESWGSLYGTGMIKNEKGEYIVGANGLPKTESMKIGSVSPDWLAGFRSELRWKDLTFGFLLDFRKGGDVFSVSQMWGSYTGLLDYTAEGDVREKPIVVGKDVLADMGTFVKEDGTPNDLTTDAKSFFYSYYLSNRQLNVFEGSYLKLREVHLTYTFPKELMKKTRYIKGANVSLIGNNLAILWLHSSNKAHIDPESSTRSDNNGVGLESGSYMPSRSMGIKVGLTF
ncbi:SusC/RagA family TonB-linked outer membrane protein [uncultured Parabacteroides sp.]|uniref:SusC/RagA family TonB-linked outer membrane protein n=1 Tax=uncultured Parabacteroides sp. TaxID=512312 RepID=UPI0025EA6E17|nr:SusC/RagA family TonB-linked outer membrane protein [uncultured Parabacteroides sp.]